MFNRVPGPVVIAPPIHEVKRASFPYINVETPTTFYSQEHENL